ncbi:GNAT family N-acetyltransferase [Paenarthrobacter ureafaciens]|nr:GNAT family N-acetyltransferase [Paenarthrobacter ureafaciens]
MLADTPMAYIESLDAARRQTDAQWQERAKAMSGDGSVTLIATDAQWQERAKAVSGDGSVTLIAEENNPARRIRGLMRVALTHPQKVGNSLHAVLISVYVAPEYRGLGLADELLVACCDAAAHDLGAQVLELGVHEDNARALSFYQRHGFSLTGESKPFPQDKTKRELIMERRLT